MEVSFTTSHPFLNDKEIRMVYRYSLWWRYWLHGNDNGGALVIVVRFCLCDSSDGNCSDEATSMNHKVLDIKEHRDPRKIADEQRDHIWRNHR